MGIARNGDVDQEVIFAGGLDLNKDPKALADRNHVLSKNMFPNVSGILWKRPGLTVAQFVGENITQEGISTVPYCLSPLHLFPANKRSNYPYLSYGIFTNLNDNTTYLIMK